MRVLRLMIMLLLLGSVVNGQAWQWGRNGGGTSNGSNVLPYESIVDMATDRNGNVYFVAVVEATGFPTMGAQTFHRWGNRDMVLASVSCSGDLRWAKVIGSIANEKPLAVRTDTLGGVYFASSVPGFYDVHVDTDTILSGVDAHFEFLLVKYDTSGVFQWCRQPIGDTISDDNANKHVIWDIESDPSGNVYMLATMTPGKIADNNHHVIPEEASYILKYNKDGNVIKVIQPEVTMHTYTSSGYTWAFFDGIKLSVTPSQRFILSGGVYFGAPPTQFYFKINGETLTDAMFVAAFDSTGQFLWRQGNSNYSGVFTSRPSLDAKENIYLCGVTGEPDTVAGQALVNTLGGHAFPFAAKFDSSGNLKWVKNAYTNAATRAGGVGLSGNRVYVSGYYPGRIQWGPLALQNPPNWGYDIFLASFDTANGNILSLDSLESPFGYREYAAEMMSDRKGNLYIGGYMQGSLTINGNTITSAGGETDFLLVKYGTASCNSVMPLQLMDFTATREAELVRCNWRTSSETNTAHFEIERSIDGFVFTRIGTHKASGNSNTVQHYHYDDATAASTGGKVLYYRLKMVDTDGRYTYSKTAIVMLPTGQVIVYPNPASTMLHIRGNDLREVLLTDIMGRLVHQRNPNGNTEITIDISSCTPGIYLLKLTGAQGSSELRKVMVR